MPDNELSSLSGGCYSLVNDFNFLALNWGHQWVLMRLLFGCHYERVFHQIEHGRSGANGWTTQPMKDDNFGALHQCFVFATMEKGAAFEPQSLGVNDTEVTLLVASLR